MSMIAVVRYASIVILLGLCSACANSALPTEPTATFSSAPAPTAGQSGFPAVFGNARIYLATNSPASSLREGMSRFLLYDDGQFRLQYAYNPSEYAGSYEVANGVVTFNWQGWSKAGPWGSTGSLTGDTLTVRYNLIMGLSDFEDGVYVRVR
jgi:hypothetical protein